MMRWLMLLTVGIVMLAMAILHRGYGAVSPNVIIVVALSVGGAMLLMSALMGGLFLSSWARRDRSVDEFSQMGDQPRSDDGGDRR